MCSGACMFQLIKKKISLHLPSFWGKIVLFKATCQKTSLSSWIIRLLFLPLSTLFFCCWMEVFLTFLSLLVSGDRTALGEGLSPCCHFWGTVRSTPVALPNLPLLLWHIFSERRWWVNLMRQKCSSCSDGHGKKLAIPFTSSLLGTRNLNKGKSSWLFWQFQRRSSSGLDGRREAMKSSHWKTNYHVTWHVEPTIVGLKEEWGVRMEMGQKYSQHTRKFHLLQDEWI